MPQLSRLFGGLRWRLVILISAAVVPAIGLMVAHGFERRDRAAEEMRAQSLNLARLAAQEQERRIEGARQLLIALTTSDAIRLDDPAECTRQVRILVDEYEGLYSEIGWADASGRIVCHALEGTNLSIADRQYFQQAIATGAFVVGELIVGRISGVPILAFARPLRDDSGKIRGVIFANVDLRVLSASLAEPARQSGGVISILDRNGTLIARSEAAADFTGVKPAAAQLQQMQTRGELVSSFVGPDGFARQYAIVKVRDATGAPVLYVNFGRSEESLTEAIAARFRDDLMTILVFTVGMIAAAWVGVERLVRRPVSQLLHATEALGKGELHVRAAPVSSTTEFARLATAFNQMAAALEHRDLHLREGQRLEAVGQLAGGIAHDFNNLLTVILGYSASLQDQLPPLSPEAREVNELRLAAERAASLTHQLLAFSRRQMLQPKLLQINDIVSHMQVMLRRTIGANVALTVSLDDELGIIRADPAQLEQVVLNLAINARDAMPHGGVIEISTRNRVLAHGDADGAVAGEYVELLVADTGIGMDAATRARIFEPFFTTKGVRGTGLGLATVYGIVRQSGGAIRCDTAVGEGTRFHVLLPRVEGVIERGPERIQALPAGGTERVLVVDDEPAVREFVVSTLTRGGYRVAHAEDGLSALAWFALNRRVDMLVTDVRMPGMSGIELCQRLRAIQPGVPTLLISGDSAPAVLDGADGPAPVFLQKPFTPAELLRATRDALNAALATP